MDKKFFHACLVTLSVTLIIIEGCSKDEPTAPISGDTVAVAAIYSTPGEAYGVILQDSIVYLGDAQGLQIFNVASQASYRLIGQISVSGVPKDVKIKGTTVYVATNGSKIAVIDASNMSAPFVDTSVTVGGGSNDLAIDGNILAVSTNDSIIFLDISAPAAPGRLGAVASPIDGIGQGCFGIALDTGRKLAIGCCLNSGIIIVDYSDPSNPARIGQMGSTLLPLHAVLDPTNSRAYLACDDGVEIISYLQSNNPQHVSQWVPGGNGGRDVARYGTKILFASTFNGFRVGDGSNINAITSLQHFKSTQVDEPYQISCSGSRAAVAAKNKLVILTLK
ncbi:MAG: hypothetical protein RDU76_02420 [Candidatus Edwardsbacteria bacterium]|nr:hypothetical protein [Candidatus Edwardsbacteria bacterium]